MSEEDKQWLASAMQQYTFDEADKMKDITTAMKHDVANNFGPGSKEGDELLLMLEDLQVMIETHERNSLNFCMMGAMEALLTFITSHPNSEARKLAANTFTQMVQNNPKV